MTGLRVSHIGEFVKAKLGRKQNVRRSPESCYLQTGSDQWIDLFSGRPRFSLTASGGKAQKLRQPGCKGGAHVRMTKSRHISGQEATSNVLASCKEDREAETESARSHG